MKRIITSSIITLLCSSPLLADITDDNWVNSVVEGHYPQSLVNSYSLKRPGEVLRKRSAWIVDNFNQPNVPIIAAVYSNGLDAEIRLIDELGNILYDPTQDIPPLTGWDLTIESHDFSGDGQPELAVNLLGGLSSEAPVEGWIFSWDGQNLNLLSPSDGTYSLLYNPFYFDVDGDGIMDVSFYEDNQSGGTDLALFTIENGTFKRTATVVIQALVVGRNGGPGVTNFSFSVEDPSLSYFATFLNGDGDITKRGLTAALILDGAQLLQPGDINPGIETFTLPIILQESNQGSLFALGDPEAHIVMNIWTPVDATPIIPETITLYADQDTFLRNGSKNRNEGANPRLVVRSTGHNRSLVGFSIDADIDLSLVETATLKLTIAKNSNNWGAHDDRPVSVHAMTQFAQGNGQGLGVAGGQSTRGTGSGSTWKCPEDLDISDQQPDCVAEWDGGAFNPTASDSVIHLNGLGGTIEFDVTSDVAQGISAWLIKKDNESQTGRVNYYSAEGADTVADETLAPTLTIIFVSEVDPCEEDPEGCEF